MRQKPRQWWTPSQAGTLVHTVRWSSTWSALRFVEFGVERSRVSIGVHLSGRPRSHHPMEMREDSGPSGPKPERCRRNRRSRNDGKALTAGAFSPDGSSRRRIAGNRQGIARTRITGGPGRHLALVTVPNTDRGRCAHPARQGRVSGIGGSLAATLAVRRHAPCSRAPSGAPVGLDDGSTDRTGKRIGVGRRPIRPQRTEARGDTIRFRDKDAVSAWSGMRKSGRDTAGWLRLPPGSTGRRDGRQRRGRASRWRHGLSLAFERRFFPRWLAFPSSSA